MRERFSRESARDLGHRGGGEHARGRTRRVRHDPRVLRDQERVLRDLGVTRFSDEYARLRRLTRGEDFSGAQASQALTRALLGMYISALPRIERSLHDEGGRAVYAAAAAVDNIRALMHDLRGMGDQSALVERIRRECSQQALGALATDVISRLTDARSEIHQDLTGTAARRVNGVMRDLQESLTRCFADAEQRMHELVQRVLTE